MACKTIKTLPFNDRAFVGAALAAFMFGASICGEAPHAQGATEPIWPTKEWQTSSPEEQGMDSKELAKLVDFGTTSSFDSLLVVRHGKIVAEGTPEAVAKNKKSYTGQALRAVLNSNGNGKH